MTDTRQALAAQREQFEAWCIQRWRGDRNALLRNLPDADDHPDEYKMGPIEFAWQAYRAALSAQPVAGAVATEAQLNSACMSYRHDFGLMTPDEQERLRWSAKEWLHAWRKEFAQAAPAPEPSAQGEPVAPLLFVAMDDDKRAHLTWCADEAAVRDAVKGAMFFLHDGEELSPDHAEQLDGSVDELLDSGALTFEGDPPLYLYRVASAPSTPPHAVVEAVPLEWPIERAADMLTAYAELVKATGRYAEEHYIPEIENVAAELRGIAPKAAQEKP